MTNARRLAAAAALLLLACSGSGGPTDAGSGGAGGAGGGTHTGGGGEGGGGGGVSGGPIPLGQACTSLAAAVCGWLERCKATDVADDAACHALVQGSCTFDKDVAAGIARYDGGALARCVSALGTNPCVNRFLPDVCNGAETSVPGTLNAPCQNLTFIGSTCAQDAGLYCPQLGSCTTCAAGRALGEACDFFDLDHDVDVECAAGLTCASTDGGSAGTCAGKPAAGQPCNFNFDVPWHCADNAWCNPAPADGGSSTCELKVDAGEPCSDPLGCQSGLFCDSTGACKPALADGAGCADSTDCTSGYCDKDPLAVDLDADAGARHCGYDIIGEVCFTDGDCGAGSWCKGLVHQRDDAGSVPGTCAAKDLDGQPCTNSATLSRGSDSCLNPASTCLDGTCVQRPSYSRTLGQTCDNAGECADNLRCDYADPLTFEGHCVPVADDGQPCVLDDSECKPGSYCDFSTGAGVCTAYANRGQACSPGGSPQCLLLLTCQSDPDGGTGICQPYVAQGQPCDLTYGALCYDSYCDSHAGTCAMLLAQGAACSDASQCSSSVCSTTCQMACY